MGMTSLYVGLSGLRSSGNALNTTANNLANVHTEGYVRQQVIYRDQGYNPVSTRAAYSQGLRGQGVSILTINHVRDIFLDAQYRKESGRQAFYDKMYDSVCEIETHLGELEGEAYQKSVEDLRAAINEICATPTDQTAVSGLTQAAVAFVSRSQSIYDGLCKYQKTLDKQVINTVNRINEIGDEIMDLNRRIAYIEASKAEGANDLRDKRDLLLDELSKYCSIDYKEDATGSVEVYVEGAKFADNLSVNKMELVMIPGTQLMEPRWPSLDDMPVYNLDRTISTEYNTDIGELKGLLTARGSVTPTYLTMTEPDPAQYAGGATDKDYLSALNEYNLYQTSIKTSTLTSTIANFDKLVNGIIEGINNVLCPETTYTAADGTVYTVLDTDKASTSANGTYGVELFTRKYCDRYTQQTIDGQNFYVRNNTSTFGLTSSYTIDNVTVNDVIRQDYSMLPLYTENNEEDFAKAKELFQVFKDDQLFYNGGLDKLSFEEFYETMTLDVANTGSIYNSLANNGEILAASLDNERQAIMGTASDEELTTMIKYQQAYNAASRYINVISDMLNSLITMMGA